MKNVLKFIKTKAIEYKKIKISINDKEIKKYWTWSWVVYTFIYPIIRIFTNKDNAITFCEKFLKFPKSQIREGINLRDKEDWDIFIEVFLRDVYRKDLLKNSMVVVDVGAHIGIYSVLASRKAGKIIAIEPFSKNYDRLRDNTSHIKNIITKKIALSDKEGKCLFYVSKFSFSHSLVEDIVKTSGSYYETEVMVSTLDKLLEEIKINKVDLIKIDAEGEELNILRGAQKTLKNNPNVIVIAASYHYPEEKKEVIGFLKERGFDIKSDEIDIVIAGK